MNPKLKWLQRLVVIAFQVLAWWAVFCTVLVLAGFFFNLFYPFGLELSVDSQVATIANLLEYAIYIPIFFIAARLAKSFRGFAEQNWSDWPKSLRTLSRLLIANFFLGVLVTATGGMDSWSHGSFQQYGSDPRTFSDTYDAFLRMLWFADGLYPLFVPQFYGAASLLLALILFAISAAIEQAKVV